MKHSKKDLQAFRLHLAFLRFVQKIEIVGDCWIWTGARNRNDMTYGQFRDENTKRVQAHTFAYEFFVGPIKKGLQPDHLCRIPACVNPRHIEPVTNLENALRGVKVVPCLHGKRAISHCTVCRNQRARDRMRKIKGTIRGNDKHREPHTNVGVLTPNSLLAILDATVTLERSNRAAIMRKALSHYLQENYPLIQKGSAHAQA